MTRPLSTTFARPGRRGRRGVTFIEVMFAVVLLGIGFIMLAALFPVAIQQTQNTVDETAAANLINEAVKRVSEIADNSTLLPTSGKVERFENALWNAVKGDVITRDGRMAWVPLYLRKSGDPFAQLIVILAKSPTPEGFSAADLNQGGTTLRGQLLPRPVKVILSSGGADQPDLIEFAADTSKVEEQEHRAAVATGGYVVISDDNHPGDQNGRVYRIGLRRTDLDNTNQPSGMDTEAWELSPGEDMIDNRENLPERQNAPEGVAPASYTNHKSLTNLATGFVLGRPYNSSLNPPYEGLVMDITAYTTLIRIK